MIIKNRISEYLESFPIPEKYEDLECLICLEKFDLESGNKFIRLPCECSNSTYHIECLTNWILSGPNKNYCVQCKGKFDLPDTDININPNENINTNTNTNSSILTNLEGTMIEEQRNNIKKEYAFARFISHIIFNITVNLINFAYICGIKTKTNLKILALLYLLKALSNFVIFSGLNKNTDSINFGILIGCMSQFMLIMLTIVVLKEIKNHPVLVYSQIGFICVDLTVSIIYSYICSIRLRNVIYHSENNRNEAVEQESIQQN